MKKVIFTSLVLVVMLFTLTGCFSKQKISIEKFDETMTRLELKSVKDTKYTYSEIDILDGRKSEYKDNVIHYYVLSGAQDAKVMFEREKNVVMSYKKETNTTRYIYETNMANYNTYKISTGTHYAYISRVDNTLLFIDGLADDEEFFDELIEDLGY